MWNLAQYNVYIIFIQVNISGKKKVLFVFNHTVHLPKSTSRGLFWFRITHFKTQVGWETQTKIRSVKHNVSLGERPTKVRDSWGVQTLHIFQQLDKDDRHRNAEGTTVYFSDTPLCFYTYGACTHLSLRSPQVLSYEKNKGNILVSHAGFGFSHIWTKTPDSEKLNPLWFDEQALHHLR